MAIDTTGLIVPKFGAIFTAAENTNPLAVLADFTLAGGPAGWNHWGHLSRENLPESSADGGDTTTYSTWLQMNTDSDTEESVDSVIYSLLQQDAASIAAVASLNGTKVSVLELWVSGTKRFGTWYPSAKASANGRPTPNGTDQYAEMKLGLTILTPSMTPALSTLVNVPGGIAPWPSAASPNSLYIDNSAFVPSTGVPLIVAALPAAQAVGEPLVLHGSRFTGTTGITIDGVAVTVFDVLSAGEISLVIPAAVAGAAAIVVTNASGASASFAYTAA